MTAFNRVELIGYLGRDPETRFRAYILARPMQMLDRKPGEQEIVAEGEAEEAVPA
jgi:hypothetical protein